MTSYASMKMASDAKQTEEKKLMDRRKALVVLILRHLCDHGYIDTAERLSTEAQVSLANVDVADNIDLLTIVQEFEDYYELRFQRKPKLTRKVGADQRTPAELAKLPTIHKDKPERRKKPSDDDEGGGAKPAGPGGRPPPHAPVRQNSTGGAKPARPTSAGGADPSGGIGSALTCTKVEEGALSKAEAAERYRRRGAGGGGGGGADDEEPAAFFERRLLKPLPDFGGNGELRELGAQIQRDVLSASPDVRWEDVISNDDAKRLLKEAVVMPIRYPQLFQGLLTPWRGVLLYGPPGTGKTMLAKAVATECKTTFFNISASSIVSKWRGDSEKLVRVLFELARYHAPSTIFLDEIDSIMSQRVSGGQEHDGSRRMKTELLIQMDGVIAAPEQVFLLCASNLPWDLDSALLRRLEKRIFVPLPNDSARRAIVAKHLSPDRAPGIDYDMVARRTDGFSGSDMVLLCKEAAMRPLRRIMQHLESAGPAVSTDRVRLGPVLPEDMEASLAATKPAQRVNDDKYARWATDFGSN